MKIGVPKEILDQEYRVALTPNSVATLGSLGHQVLIEAKAGVGSGFDDEDYHKAGAVILPSAREVYAQAKLIVKVKQPLDPDLNQLRADHILFTFLHLAPDPVLAKALCEIGLTAYSYETIQSPDGLLPALLPMSEIAGRLSIQIGAHFLEKAHGGSGVLLSGIPGVPRGRVVVLGGGIAGTQAARVAIGMGAEVTIFEKSPKKLRELDQLFSNRARILDSNSPSIASSVKQADLVIGAVLIPGKKPPLLVKEDTIAAMRAGSVVLDIAIDQGGCIETIRPTKHSEPTYLVHEVIHYGVTNMPGAVPRTSTIALNNATLPYAIELAGGYEGDLSGALNIKAGKIVHPAVEEQLNGLN
ncbi:MAG: alanine dehydrogenase [Candidatus Caenarcaniphilales bacterium]|nr:alanine dehydrogenase [Candidatus Caenarcaniphilales bacterium]